MKKGEESGIGSEERGRGSQEKIEEGDEEIANLEEFDDDDGFEELELSTESPIASPRKRNWVTSWFQGAGGAQRTQNFKSIRADLSFGKKISSRGSPTTGRRLVGAKLTKQQMTTLKEELLRMALKNEEARVREDATIATLLRETELLSFVFTFFLETFPLFKDKPVFEDLEELFSLLPPLSSSSEREGKRTRRDGIWKKIMTACTWIFSNMLTLEDEGASDSQEEETNKDQREENPEGDSESSSLRYSAIKPTPSDDSPLLFSRDDIAEPEKEPDEEEVFMNDLEAFLNALKNTSGAIFKDLFKVVKESSTVNELPPQYRSLVTTGKVLFANHLHARLGDTELITKIRQIYRLTPVRLLKVALKISSPGALIERVLSLFLKRVMRAPNLLQQLYRASSKTSKSESLRTAASDQVKNSRIRQKIQSYIQRRFDERLPHVSEQEPDPIRRIWLILVDTTLQPVLTIEEIQELTSSDYWSIRELLLHETRVKDKHAVYDFLGDARVIEIAKGIFPVIHTPLIEVLSKVDTGAFLDLVFGFLGQLTTIAEEERKLVEQNQEEDSDEELMEPVIPDVELYAAEEEEQQQQQQQQQQNNLAPPSRPRSRQNSNATPVRRELDALDFAKRFEVLVGDFIDNAYKFLHLAAVNDQGTLESLTTWLVERLDLIRNGADPLDMHDIVALGLTTIPTPSPGQAQAQEATPASSTTEAVAATPPLTPSTRAQHEVDELFQNLLKEIHMVEEFRRQKKEIKEQKLKNLMHAETAASASATTSSSRQQEEKAALPEVPVMRMLLRPFIRHVKGRLFRSGVFQLSFINTLEKYAAKRKQQQQ